MAEYRDLDVSDLPYLLGEAQVTTEPEKGTGPDEFSIQPKDLDKVLGGSTDKSFKSSYKGPSYFGASVIDPLAATIVKAAPFGLGYVLVGKDGERRANDVLDYYGPKVSVPADIAAGVGRAGSEYFTLLKTLGLVGAAASQAKNLKYVEPVVKAVSKTPVVKQIAKGATSTNPFVQAGTLSSVLGTGVAIGDLATGDDLLGATTKGLSTAANVAAYTLGGRLLPKKAVPFAMSAYETLTGAGRRAFKGKEVLDPYEVSQDATRGFLFGSGVSKSGPTDPSIKTSSSARAGDIYKEPTPGVKSSTKVMLKNIEKAPKKANDTLFDLDTPENKRFFKELSKKDPTVAGSLAEETFAPKKSASAENLIASINEKNPHIRSTNEAMENHVNNLGSKALGPFTEPIRDAHLKGQTYVPKRRVDRIMGKEGPVRDAFEGTYNRTSAESWNGDILRPNEGYDTLEILKTKKQLSKIGLDNNSPYHKEASEKIRLLFGKDKWAQGYKQADKVWSDAQSTYDDILKNPTGSSAQMRDILRTLEVNADANTQVNELISKGSLTDKAFPKGFRDALARYNYYAEAENLLRSMGAGTNQAKLGQAAAEAIGAKTLAGRFADWLAVKSGIKRVSDAVSRRSLSGVVENLGTKPVSEAVKALTAKHGKILKPEMYIPAVYDIIKNLPKR